MWFKTLATSLMFVAIFGAQTVQADDSDELAQMARFMTVLEGYYNIIEATYDIASDPEKAVILQMVKVKEIYEERREVGTAVKILRDVLDNSENPTVRRAAVLILSDLLNETGRSDAAVEVLTKGLEESVRDANAAVER